MHKKLMFMLLIGVSVQITASEKDKKIDTSKLTANQYRELLYSKSISEAIAFESKPVFDTNVFGELVQLTQEQVAANIAANMAANREFLNKETEQNNPYDTQILEPIVGNSHMFWSHSFGQSGFWSALRQARPERLYFDVAPRVAERSAHYMPPALNKDTQDSSHHEKASVYNELDSEK